MTDQTDPRLRELAAMRRVRDRIDRDYTQPLDVEALAALPAAVRTRLLRDLALRLGCPAGALSAGHIAALDALVTDWHGQGPVNLPGGRVVCRRNGRIA